MEFEKCNLDERLLRGVREAGYEKATPIQAAVMPAILGGCDVIGTAQTGTGKTAAFVLPILQRMLQNPEKGGTRVLILAPTRELAEQIREAVKELGRHTAFRSATVYGGVGMAAQEEALRRGVEIVVACPGRLLDHMGRGYARLDRIETLVLDEADRMLDMGFYPSIQKILGLLPARRQTLLFSATFNADMERLIKNALREPERFSVSEEIMGDTVGHALYPVNGEMKNCLLLQLLKEVPAQNILVFTRTKHRADRVAKAVLGAGHRAASLHANKSQSQRKHIMDQFKSGRLSVLVATDIASRGLDIANVSHVINYDMPDSATTYVHRIGRTGRAHRTGEALTLATWEDADVVKDIEKILGQKIKRATVEGLTDSKALPVINQNPKAKPNITLSNRCTVTVPRRRF